jgi:hypothetical protein
MIKSTQRVRSAYFSKEIEVGQQERRVLLETFGGYPEMGSSGATKPRVASSTSRSLEEQEGDIGGAKKPDQVA